jgi:hypothetical protein
MELLNGALFRSAEDCVPIIAFVHNGRHDLFLTKPSVRGKNVALKNMIDSDNAT